MSTTSMIGFAITRYLKKIKESTQNPEDVAKAITLIEGALDCKATAENFLSLSTFPKDLEEIFNDGVKVNSSFGEQLALAEKDEKFIAFEDQVKSKGFYEGVAVGSLEYLERQSKLLQKYVERTGSSLGAAPQAPGGNAKAEEEAEDKKGLGNTAMTAKDYDLAVQFYSEAISLSSNGPNSHVYYSNRAAAYCSLNRYQEAVKDCEASIRLVPDYCKAVARLGLANFYMERYAEAIHAYEQAVKLEPDNKSHADALSKAKSKLAKKQAPKSAPSSSSVVAPSSSSSLSSSSSSSSQASIADMMAQMGGMGGGMGGGMPPGGLGAMLNDPAMLSVAQNMMKNPAMMQKVINHLPFHLLLFPTTSNPSQPFLLSHRPRR